MKPFSFLGIVNIQKKLKPVTERNPKFQKIGSPILNMSTAASKRQAKSARLEHLQLSPHTKVDQTITKKSSTQNGIVVAYAANTNQGIVRDYNEDRVTIILNFLKPTDKNVSYWPKCSFFGVYDGHGGYVCAEYLRDSLHHFILGDSSFPENPELAIKKGFERAEEEFIQQSITKGTKANQEKSGSCALVALVVDNECYVANVGDSRAVMSMSRGKITSSVTVDHKPSNATERQRVVSNGGQVYQNKVASPHKNSEAVGIGPLRIFPGGLSVSRTIGDATAKLKQFDGLPNVISAIPDITKITISEEHDFLFLGCDGIFDRLINQDISDIFWRIRKADKSAEMHDICKSAVEDIINESLMRQSFDNVTGVLIAFNDLLLMDDSPNKTVSSRNSMLSQIKMATNYMELLPVFPFKTVTKALNTNRSLANLKIRHINRAASHRPRNTEQIGNVPEVVIKNLSSQLKIINSRKAILKPING